MRGLEYASSLGEVSQQLGVTAKDLQEYRYAASQVGIEQEQMDKGLARLSITLGQVAQGAKGPTEALERLGLSTEEIARVSHMTAGDALPVLADAFAKIKSPTEQAALAAELFGAKVGPKFLTLLANGSAAINELRDSAQSLGIVLSDEQIQNADDTADKLAALNQVLEARVAGVVADNAGAIYDLADALAHLAGEALNAAGAWVKTQRVLGQRESMRAGARARLARDPRVNDRNRAATERLAFDMIDRRLGINEQSAGGIPGLLEFKRQTVDTTNREFGSGDMSYQGILRQVVPDIHLPGRPRGASDAEADQAGAGDRGGGRGGGRGGSSGSARAQEAREAQAAAQAAEDADRRTAAAMAGITGNFEKMTDSLRSAIDTAMPEIARLTEYREKLAALEGRGIMTADGYTAESRLRVNLLGTGKLGEAVSPNLGSDVGPIANTDQAMRDLEAAMDGLAKKAGLTSVKVAQSFKDMADDTLQSFDRLTSAIKGGGFLDILNAALGLGLQLGSIGVFGKTIQANLNRVPGYASGTGYHPGGLAMVGERGMELVELPRGSRVHSNDNTRRMMGGDTYYLSGNLLTPEFWAMIQSGDVRAAQGGAVLARAQGARSKKWSLG